MEKNLFLVVVNTNTFPSRTLRSNYFTRADVHQIKVLATSEYLPRDDCFQSRHQPSCFAMSNNDKSLFGQFVGNIIFPALKCLSKYFQLPIVAISSFDTSHF